MLLLHAPFAGRSGDVPIDNTLPPTAFIHASRKWPPEVHRARKALLVAGLLDTLKDATLTKSPEVSASF